MDPFKGAKARFLDGQVHLTYLSTTPEPRGVHGCEKRTRSHSVTSSPEKAIRRRSALPGHSEQMTALDGRLHLEDASISYLEVRELDR